MARLRFGKAGNAFNLDAHKIAAVAHFADRILQAWALTLSTTQHLALLVRLDGNREPHPGWRPNATHCVMFYALDAAHPLLKDAPGAVTGVLGPEISHDMIAVSDRSANQTFEYLMRLMLDGRLATADADAWRELLDRRNGNGPVNGGDS